MKRSSSEARDSLREVRPRTSAESWSDFRHPEVVDDDSWDSWQANYYDWQWENYEEWESENYQEWQWENYQDDHREEEVPDPLAVLQQWENELDAVLAQHQEEEAPPDPVADPFPVENEEEEEEIPVEEELEVFETDGDWNEHDRAPVFSGTSAESCIFFWTNFPLKRKNIYLSMRCISVLF